MSTPISPRKEAALRSILILGGGVMQLPAIRLAKERGWRVTVADANPSAAGGQEAHRFLPIDLKDKEAIERAARMIAAEEGLDGVFTAGTDFSATVAWVAERLGLPGIPYEAALRATDKSLMRAAFRAAGVPSPDFVSVSGEEDPVGAAASLRYPLVVKPVDNMGARGIRRIDEPRELSLAVALARELSRSRKVIIEEFVPGPEFSLDAIVDGGRITITGVADRIIRFAPYFVETGHTIPTAADRATVERVCAAFEAGIRALGIERGAAKGDVKLSPAGPVIGEIAARLSGGYMSGWTYPYASGSLVTGAGLNIAVGLPAGDLSPRWKMVCAERAFISIPGRVARVAGIEEAERAPFVKNLFVRVAPGEPVTFPTNNVEKCGNVIAQAPTREEAVRAAEDAAARILILLEPTVAETAAFLFGDRERWAPPAFDLQAGGREPDPRAAAVASHLAELPLYRIGTGRTGIGILPLPGIEELDLRDWQGRRPGEALASAYELAPITPAGAREDFRLLLGRLFWQPFLRGSIQGAVWLAQTVEELLRAVAPEEPRSLEEGLFALLQAWEVGR